MVGLTTSCFRSRRMTQRTSSSGLTLPARVNLKKDTAMNLTIELPEEDVQALRAKATARGISAEQYALQVLAQDLAPEWLRKSWASAREAGIHQLSMEEIEAEIAAARKARNDAKPRPGA